MCVCACAFVGVCACVCVHTWVCACGCMCVWLCLHAACVCASVSGVCVRV